MSNSIKCAIFDLDGTLINTIDDLAASCEVLLEKHGFELSWSIDDYKRFVGSGAKMLVSRAFNNTLDDDTLDKYYSEFKNIYKQSMLNNAYVYEGVSQQLDLLKEKGIKLCVVTNKPDEAAVIMVEHFFGKGYFDYIIGYMDSVPKKPDPTSTKKALSYVGCKAGEAIYFGDSEIDIRTAHNADVEAVGCSWGFRSFAQLFNENPSVIIDDPIYISKLF